MNVLIIGGAGFIGFNLARHLKSQGMKIFIADNFKRGQQDDEFKSLLEHENVSLIPLDITVKKDFARLKGNFDHVYHLAAINGTRNFYEIPDQVLSVGAAGTINVLEWFSKHNKQGKIMFSSSSEVYAGLLEIMGEKFPIPTPENVSLAVQDPRNLRWSYGASKIFGEVAFFSYSKARKFDRFSIVRYHNIFGPRMGDDHVIPQFIGRILKKEDPFRVFGGDQTRSFCYIDDAIEATQLVMEKGETDGEIVNIGRNDSEMKINDLAEELFGIADFHPDVKLEPALPGAVKRRCPDISKLLSLGFKNKMALKEGLKKTYDWYKYKFEQ